MHDSLRMGDMISLINQAESTYIWPADRGPERKTTPWKLERPRRKYLSCVCAQFIALETDIRSVYQVCGSQAFPTLPLCVPASSRSRELCELGFSTVVAGPLANAGAALMIDAVFFECLGGASNANRHTCTFRCHSFVVVRVQGLLVVSNTTTFTYLEGSMF
jgi:hypothetical protein